MQRIVLRPSNCGLTGTRDPHVVVADVNLAAGVVVAEEVDWGQDRDGVVVVVHAREGHGLRVDVVCERLVADLQKKLDLSTDTRGLWLDFLTRGEAYPT